MYRPTTEETKKLSIFFLNREGYLSGGVIAGTIRWLVGERERLTAKVAGVIWGDFSFVRVSYWYKKNEWEKKREYVHQIQLASTPCHFGRERYWFLCPKCHQRRAILYIIAEKIQCRVCFDLSYESKLHNWHSAQAQMQRYVWRAFEAEQQLNNLRVKMWKGKLTKKCNKILNQLYTQIPQESQLQKVLNSYNNRKKMIK